MEYCFGNCSSLTYIGYRCSPESTEFPVTKYCVDLEHIAAFEREIFINYKSLESIKSYDQFIHQDTFCTCENLKRISSPVDMYIQFDPSLDTFNSKKVEQLMICSNIKDISYAIGFYMMYEINLKNPQLFEQKCRQDNLYPFKVAVGVLALSLLDLEKPDIIKFIFERFVPNLK